MSSTEDVSKDEATAPESTPTPLQAVASVETTHMAPEKDSEGRTIVKSEAFQPPLKLTAEPQNGTTAKGAPKVELKLDSPRAIEACMRQVCYHRNDSLHPSFFLRHLSLFSKGCGSSRPRKEEPRKL